MSITCLNLSPVYELVYSVREQDDEEHTAEAFGIVPSGKGLNVAAMLAREGVDVELITPSLQGPMAAGYFADVREAVPSLNLRKLDDVAVPLRYSTIIVNSGDPFQRRIYRTTLEPHPQADQYIRALKAKVETSIGGSSAIVMSGHPGAFGAQAYSAVIELARDHGCPTYLDVSGAALNHVLRGAWPSVIKINRDEADHEHLLGEGSVDEYPSIVVVTNGPHDIEFFDPITGEQGRVSPPNQNTIPVSPTGAGDAFMAGLVWARHISMRAASLESQILKASEWGGRAVSSLNSGIGVGRE